MGKELATVNNHFVNSYFSMQADKELEQFAKSRRIPAPMRLYFLAASRVNRWGHCAFRQAEIKQTLGVSQPTLRSALDSLKSAGMAAPDSTYLCVVLSARLVRRADRSEYRCAEPSHLGRQELMWMHDFGWEETVGQWQRMLHNPAERRTVAAQITRTRTVTETETVTLLPEFEGMGLTSGSDAW